MKICPHCGALTTESAKFCPECGKHLGPNPKMHAPIPDGTDIDEADEETLEESDEDLSVEKPSQEDEDEDEDQQPKEGFETPVAPAAKATNRFQFIEGTGGDQPAEAPTRVQSRSLAGDAQMLALAIEGEEAELKDETALTQVRTWLDQWAESTPHHPYKNLGREIAIQSLQSLGCYRAELLAQLETRTLRRDDMPYRNEPIGPKLIHNIAEVDAWAYNADLTTSFNEKSNTYVLQASREVVGCPNCGGNGEVTCGSCSGKGETRCYSCDGRGEIKCSSCSGSGHKRCFGCSGSGYTGSGSSRSRCSSCGGRGSSPCTNCRNGYQNCSNCGGRGNITCRSCAGRGRVTCYQCDGNRQIISFICFDDEFTVKKDAVLVCHPQLPQDLLTGNPDPIFKLRADTQLATHQPLIDIKKLSRVEVKKTVLSIATQNGPDLLLLEQEQVPISVADGLAHTALGKALKSLLEGEAGSKALGKGSQNTRQLNHRLRVTKLRAWKLFYTFENKSYELIFFGDGPLIWAPTSPISEVAKGYVRQGNEALARQAPDMAYDLVEKALAINNDAPEAITLKRRVGAMFRADIFIGAGLAMLTLLLVGDYLDALIVPRWLRERSVPGTFPLIAGRVLLGITAGLWLCRDKALLWPLKRTTVAWHLLAGIAASLAMSYVFYLFGVHVLGQVFAPATFEYLSLISTCLLALTLQPLLSNQEKDGSNPLVRKVLGYSALLLYVPSLRMSMVYSNTGTIDSVLWLNLLAASAGLVWSVGYLAWRWTEFELRPRQLRIATGFALLTSLLVLSLALRRLLLYWVGT